MVHRWKGKTHTIQNRDCVGHPKLIFGGVELVEVGLDGVALAGHVEFGEEGEGLVEFLFCGVVVAAPKTLGLTPSRKSAAG